MTEKAFCPTVTRLLIRWDRGCFWTQSSWPTRGLHQIDCRLWTSRSSKESLCKESGLTSWPGTKVLSRVTLTWLVFHPLGRFLATQRTDGAFSWGMGPCFPSPLQPDKRIFPKDIFEILKALPPHPFAFSMYKYPCNAISVLLTDSQVPKCRAERQDGWWICFRLDVSFTCPWMGKYEIVQIILWYLSGKEEVCYLNANYHYCFSFLKNSFTRMLTSGLLGVMFSGRRGHSNTPCSAK